jgi:hypothetical protein
MTWLTDMKQVPPEVLPYVVFILVFASVLLIGTVVRMLVRRVRYRHPVYDNLIAFEQRGREIRRRKRKLPRIRWHPCSG